jgi:hypothetical protein
MCNINSETIPAPKAVHASMKKVVERLEFFIKYETENVAKWLSELQKNIDPDPSNPYSFIHNNLRWSDKAMASAARLHVYACVMMRAEMEREKVIAYAENELVNNAASPSFSTSYCANYMHVLEGAAWANVFELVKNI